MNFDPSREWLEANGIGGFACGTLINCNTRRYHALLCAATQPPLGRMVLVNKADETLSLRFPGGERHFDLGCNQYPGTIHPNGYQFLSAFDSSPLPTWTFVISQAHSGLDGDIVFQKTVWMPHGHNTTVCRYTLLECPDQVQATLSVRPFVTGRDYHSTHAFNHEFNTHIERLEDATAKRVQMQPYPGTPPLYFAHDGEFYEGGTWYCAFEYAIEQERGLDCHEDAFCPGAFVWPLRVGKGAAFVVSIEPEASAHLVTSDEAEIARRTKLQSVFDNVPDGNRLPAHRLALAADQFLVRRSDGLHTVLAGYPWFTDWGRDTMIALPGLCLSTKRFDAAASILRAFARSASQGMIPNRFPDGAETPDYNTVDATLWYFHAVEQYIALTQDAALLNELYPVLKDSIAWHLKGTRYGIRADESDGCLRAGNAQTQLTWMDAKVGGWVVTPRQGKPVEIQALWFNALRAMSGFAFKQNDEATQALCDEWSDRLLENFRPLFWNETEKCLFDVVTDDGPDGALRPNQIFVVSLPHRLLPDEDEAAIVEAVRRDLLTPHGLRSLSPRDSRYRGIYEGDQWSRDGSYHQGTVWGWLLGPFLSAYLKVNRHAPEATQQAHEWIKPMLAHLDEACIGSISEIFDGDAPHTPRGCFAQAWSVSETLRVLVGEL